MADTTHQATSSRLGQRSGGGEIVEVQGGHIVRSTGRKDRHSKVCTAKGPRDRRVRLSANTAIQFYDVQDRLGYDRPSKAVDWLIKKAKVAIDELAELPAWNPPLANANFEQDQAQMQQKQELRTADTVVGSSSSKKATAMALLGTNGAARRGIQNQNRPLQMSSESSSGFLRPSLDSDAIADTIKSFFPIGAAAETNSSAMQFQNFPPPDLLSRISSQSQDLRLSLQSFQDPMLLHHHADNQTSHHQNPTQAIFSGTTQLGFDASGWSEQQQARIGRFQRMAAWNAGGDAESGGGGGFFLNSPPSPLLGHNHLFSQRGPLQSSNPPSIRAWIDSSSIASATTADHHHQTLPLHPSSVPGIGFASGGEFSGFRIPARIQGEEEGHDGVAIRPSSASSESRH